MKRKKKKKKKRSVPCCVFRLEAITITQKVVQRFEPHLLEALHRDRAALKTCLDAVTHLGVVPTGNQLDALLQSMETLIHWEFQPAPDDYLILFRLQNLPDYLERLHVEAQVLRQACRESDVPTRSLLEQQVLLKHTGVIVLDHVDDLLAVLHSNRDSSGPETEINADLLNDQEQGQLYPEEESMTCSASSCVENEEE